MNRTAGSLAVALLVMILLPGAISAQSTDGATTIWDGVYTSAQAQRGQQLVDANCSACHTAAEWSNSNFLNTWAGRPVDDLNEFLSQAMPLDSPGKLKESEYADIVAYMLSLNHAPAGQNELPAEKTALARIHVTRANSN